MKEARRTSLSRAAHGCTVVGVDQSPIAAATAAAAERELSSAEFVGANITSGTGYDG